MLSRLARAWRVIATWLGFATFYTAGLLIAPPVVLVLRAMPGTREEQHRRVQRGISLAFRIFIAYLRLLGAYTWRREELTPLAAHHGVLLVANHPTLLDVVFLISVLPEVDCIIKKAVWDHAVMRVCVRGAGYIPNDEGPELVEHCAERLKLGHRVLLFPEGTRSPPGQLGRFQRGAARSALRSGAAIVPILIRCEPPMLTKGRRWTHAAERRSRYSFEIGAPIEPAPFLEDGRETPTGVRRLTEHLQEYFERELGSTPLRPALDS